MMEATLYEHPQHIVQHISHSCSCHCWLGPRWHYHCLLVFSCFSAIDVLRMRDWLQGYAGCFAAHHPPHTVSSVQSRVNVYLNAKLASHVQSHDYGNPLCALISALRAVGEETNAWYLSQVRHVWFVRCQTGSRG